MDDVRLLVQRYHQHSELADRQHHPGLGTDLVGAGSELQHAHRNLTKSPSRREAIFAIVFGSFVMGIPMSLNGYVGARTHAPFPILARASFGYHLAKFPVALRLATALFWHSITNFLAVGPMIQVVRSIFPSFRNIPNSIPESVGITTQQMVAYLLVFLVQFPVLLIPPHKMRWLFTAKVVMSMATLVGMVIWICVRAGGSGDIWDQSPTVSGSSRSWMIVWSLNSCTASWSTVGTNM